MPDPSSLPFPGPSRSNSLASTASSSGASLTRRSRISRKRTRTITTDLHPDDKSTAVVDQVLDISAANDVVPALDLVTSPSGTPNSKLATRRRASEDPALRPDVRGGRDANRSGVSLNSFHPLMDDHETSPADSGRVHTLQNHPGAALPSETVASPQVRLLYHFKCCPTSTPFSCRQKAKADIRFA